jgi:hypothetical protein
LRLQWRRHEGSQNHHLDSPQIRLCLQACCEQRDELGPYAGTASSPSTLGRSIVIGMHRKNFNLKTGGVLGGNGRESPLGFCPKFQFNG